MTLVSGADLIDDTQQQVTSKPIPKKIYQVASQTESFELNRRLFNIRTSYYKGFLLNGIELLPMQARGIQDYDQTLQIIQNGSILYRCGLHIFDYNSRLNTYKPFKQAGNVISISVFRQSILARTLIGVLCQNNHNQYSIEVYEYHNKQRVFSDIIKTLMGWKFINFFVHFGRKKIIWFLVCRQSQCKIVMCFVENQGHAEQKLDFLIEGIHYNKELSVYIAFSKNYLYLLTHEEMSGFGHPEHLQQNQNTPVFYVKRIYQCPESEIKFCCSNSEFILVASYKCLYLLGNHKRNLIKKVLVEQLLAQSFENSEFKNVAVLSCLEFIKGTIIAGFERLSALCCIQLVSQTIWKTRIVKFNSHNFVKFTRLLIDPQGSFLFTISAHHECIESEGRICDDLQLGEPKPNTQLSANSRKQLIRFGELQLKMLNHEAAFKIHQIEKLDYINILSGPWSSEVYYHTSNRIQCSKWDQPVPNGLCSAIHPTSFYLAVGFRDSFRIFAVTITGLASTNLGDIAKQCRALAYSSYGNHLAVGSMNLVQVYQSFTCIKTHVITHTQSTIIRSLKYNGDQLHCVTRNSAINIYSMTRNYAKQVQFHPKQFANSSQKQYSFDIIQYDSEYDVFIAVAQHQIKFFTNRGKTQFCSHTMPFKITSLELCFQLKVMFLGTDVGSILSFTWPNNPNQIQLQYPYRSLHQSAVVLLKVSNNLSTLTSISAKGSFFISQIRVVECMKQVSLNQIEYEHRSKICMNDLLLLKKVAFFSLTSKALIEAQIKQMEQKVLNKKFMEPQQQQKRKNQLTGKVSASKGRLTIKHNEFMALTNNLHTELKQKIVKCKQEIQNLYQQNQNKSEKLQQIQKTKMAELATQRTLLQSNYLSLQKKCLQQITQMKLRQQIERDNFAKQKNHLSRILEARVDNQFNFARGFQQNYGQEIQNNFEEIQLIKQRQLRDFIIQIGKLSQTNSLLANNNYKIEKDIALIEKKHSDLLECTQLLQQSLNQFQLSSNQRTLSQQMSYNQRILDIQLNSVKHIRKVLQEIQQIQLLQISFRQMRQLLDTLDSNIFTLNSKVKYVMKIMAQQKEQNINLNNQIASKIIQLKKVKEKVFKFKRNNIFYQNNEMNPIKCSEVCEETKTMQRKKTQVYRSIDSYNRICHTLQNDYNLYSKTLRKTNQQKQDLIEYLNNLKKQHFKLHGERQSSKFVIKQQSTNYESFSDRRFYKLKHKKTNFDKYVQERKFQIKRKYGRSQTDNSNYPQININSMKN